MCFGDADEEGDDDHVLVASDSGEDGSTSPSPLSGANWRIVAFMAESSSGISRLEL